jgi:hypothetical protein
MRTSIKKAGLLAAMAAFGFTAFAQGIQPDLQYFRLPGYDGLNVFETGKKNEVQYDGFKVRLGADFALQFQGLDHEAMTNAPYRLVYIAPSVNLPTANLNIDAQLADGLRVHLRTYLSARHHNESWVKGGYIMIDRLDFIKEGFAEGLMDIMSVKMGVDNFSYGDAVYRRSDNAMAIYNPFVGNYLMDNNTVEPFMELQFFPGDFIAIGGISTGILNPTVVRNADPNNNGDPIKMPPTFHGKLGWDSQLSQDLRVRVTASFYTSAGYNNGRNLYNGDRAGGRYYKVFDYIDTATNATTVNDFSGRVTPGFSNQTAFQINPFVKFQGLEFFGVFEVNSGLSSQTQEDNNFNKGSYTQIGAELIYRFGSWEQFYVGGRYNTVSGYAAYAENADQPEARTVNRLNIGGGWFMTKNVLVKAEYVSQVYNDQWTSTSNNLMEAKFNGFMIEAVIGF